MRISQSYYLAEFGWFLIPIPSKLLVTTIGIIFTRLRIVLNCTASTALLERKQWRGFIDSGSATAAVSALSTLNVWAPPLPGSTRERKDIAGLSFQIHTTVNLAEPAASPLHDWWTVQPARIGALCVDEDGRGGAFSWYCSTSFTHNVYTCRLAWLHGEWSSSHQSTLKGER